jgi:hypothetical protein
VSADTTIVDVEQAAPDEALVGAYIDRPEPASEVDTTTFEVSGWVVARNSGARHVEILSNDLLLRTVEINVPRPDVVTAHPMAPAQSGFWTMIGTLGLSRDFELELHVVLEDGSHAPLGWVRGRRTPIESRFDPSLRPLILTSLGRTGTTLVMRLLSAHPRVVTHDTFPYEIGPAKYWLHTLLVLAEPANHRESSTPEHFFEDMWHVGHNPFHTAPMTDSAAVRRVLGRDVVHRLAAFVQESIDDFYTAVAADQGKPQATFFAEKFHPDRLSRTAWDLYPDARELILVRDPRDMIASIYAFNAKRGTIGFGRDRFATDEQYLAHVARRMQELVDAWSERRSVSLLVKYEDLVGQPRETTEAILSYLELERTRDLVTAMLDHAMTGSELEGHRTIEDARASVGRWRRDLLEPLREVSENAFAPVLAALGYP